MIKKKINRKKQGSRKKIQPKQKKKPKKRKKSELEECALEICQTNRDVKSFIEKFKSGVKKKKRGYLVLGKKLWEEK